MSSFEDYYAAGKGNPFSQEEKRSQYCNHISMGLKGWLAKYREERGRRILAGRLLKRGNRYYQAGDFAEAVSAYREAAALTPDRPVLRFNLGLALYKQGEKAAGRAEWEAVVTLCDGKKAYLAEQARILLRQFG